MEGKTVIITGANTGIGKAAAVAIASMGARVLITARNEHKGQEAVRDIRQAAGHDQVELFLADFARLDDVRQLAGDLDEATERIDVLINNAGIILTDRQVSADGYEMMVQVNHLAPFLLTNLLLDKLKASGARIVNTSSGAYPSGGALDFDDLMAEKSYVAFPRYGRTKLMNILFTRELAKRLAGTGATTNCLHPGVVNTGFAADGDTHGWFSTMIGLFRPFYRSPEKGAATTLYLATSPDVAKVSGEYFADKKKKQLKPYARDDAAAARLWAVSEQLTGLAQQKAA